MDYKNIRFSTVKNRDMYPSFRIYQGCSIWKDIVVFVRQNRNNVITRNKRNKTLRQT